MRLLTLLLLLSTTLTAQIRVPYQYYGKGTPPSSLRPGSSNATFTDTTSGGVWRYYNNAWRVENNSYIKGLSGEPIPGPQGPKGDKGDPGESIVGPKGDKGDPGVCPSCPPSGGAGMVDLPFIYVKPHGSAQTLGQAGIPLSNYPGIGATLNDMVDWANLQYAVSQQAVNGKPLWLIAQTYYTNRSVMSGKYQYYVVVKGNYAKIQTTNNDPFAIFGRPSPTDNGDANVMIQAIWDIEDLRLYGGNQQIGIEPGPTYGLEGSGSWFKSIAASGLKTAIHGRFCLNMDIWKPSATNCTSGWIFDMGNWQNATNSNSQSNNGRTYKPRWYGGGTQDAAIKYIAASGGVVDQPIIEGGGTLRAGIDVDGKNSTVVRDFAVINGYHFENINGATESALKIRLLGGRAKLDGFYGQYPTIMVDAGSGTGSFDMDVSNVVYAVPKNGKLFRSSNTTWTGSFNNYNSGAISNGNFGSLFEVGSPSLCGGAPGCGYNRFNLITSPR